MASTTEDVAICDSAKSENVALEIKNDFAAATVRTFARNLLKGVNSGGIRHVLGATRLMRNTHRLASKIVALSLSRATGPRC